MVGYIYKYENLLNHKVYIGQTIHLVTRQQEHKSKSVYIKTKFYNAVRKYGWDNFSFEVIAEVEADTIEKLVELLDNLEIQYIQQYDSYNHGYNSTLGGGGGAGKIMPDSFIEFCKHRVYSEETRRKMSEAAKKRLQNPEYREAFVSRWKNMNAKKPPFKKSAIRDAAIRRALAKPIVQMDALGNVIREFAIIKDAARFIIEHYAPTKLISGIEHGLRRHCKGNTKKRLYYGFEWKFKADV